MMKNAKNRWVRKGMAKQTSAGYRGKSSCQTIRFSRFLQCIYESHQFFGSVEDGNIVVFALGSFLSEISSKGWVPMANVYQLLNRCLTFLRTTCAIKISTIRTVLAPMKSALGDSK